MEILTTLISLVDFYGKVSALIKGDGSSKQLERIANGIERLSDKIYYAPNIQIVQNINQSSGNSLNLREVRQSLEPVQRAIGASIVSSAMIVTPQKMQTVFKGNPWEVLDLIRPLANTVPHNNPDMVPILFEYKQERFIGWQMRGVLPSMFDCRYEDIWKPNLQASEFYTPDVKSEPNTHASVPKNSGYINVVNATVTDLRFFSGHHSQPLAKRAYKNKFTKSTTDYVSLELNLKFPKPGKRFDFKLRAICYRADGSIFSDQYSETYVESGWDNSQVAFSYGWSITGRWTCDTYTIVIYFENIEIARKSFEIE